MPTPRTPGPDPRRGRGEQDRQDRDRVVVPLRRGAGSGGLADARRYRPRGRTVREAADPAGVGRRADEARRTQGEMPEAHNAGRNRSSGPVHDTGKDRRVGQPRQGRRKPQRDEGPPDPRTVPTRRRSDPVARPPRAGEADTTLRGTAPAGRIRGATDRTGGSAAGARRRQTGSTPQARRRQRAESYRSARPRSGPGGATSGRVRRQRGARPPGERRPGIGGLRSRRLARLGSPGRRLRLGTVVVLVLFTVIAGRLVQLQLTDAHNYAERALAQRLQTVPLPAPRGAILDRNGAVLAHSVEARYVFADPSLISDPAAVATRLSPILGVPKSRLEKEMHKRKLKNGKQLQFVYLARGVDIPTGDQVEALDIRGIGVRPDEKRDVPGHDLAANIIGFTGYDLNGLTGMEAKYNNLLRGIDGERQYEAGRDGQEIPDGYHRERRPQPGGTVRLTLDRDIQYEAQRALYDKLHGTGSDMGAAIVLDVQTGEVLAQASYPTYDAADPADSTRAQRTDYASQAVVEPGSVHKPITIGAALQEGVIQPDSAIAIGSTVTKGDTTYQDTHWHGNVKITIPGIFAYSSNVGTIAVADRLGARKLYRYQLKFGLGTPTGEGMPGEAAGIVRPARDWHGADFGSIPIGLGVAVTPIQMAAAYGAIANDGEYVQPHLIEKTISRDGTRTRPTVARHRVLSPAVAKAERHAMVAVTTVDGATGTSGAINGYRVAAKTGTGQRYVHGKLQKGNIESFIGMAPAEHPRYVVLVMAHTSGHGEGANMGPVFHRLMSFTLAHQKVPPTDAKPPTFQVYR